MLFCQIRALLFIFFFATAVAGDKNSRPGQPQTTCVKHESGEVRDTYTIRGRNWNVTEAQVKDAINTPGTVLTGWGWREAMDEDGARVFRAKFRLPIHEENATKKKLAKLIEPFPFKVKCWKPSDGGKTNDLPPKDEQDVLTGKWPKYNGDFRKRV